ncbi:MAG TPA: hypothetical protein VK008_01470 [Sphingobacteriaceae bacterium]|nr:hypothetical protein [Sphingobacteriaceae bacterium]
MSQQFGRELRKWRQEAGYDLEALARFGPMTAAHLQGIEEGAAQDLYRLLHPLGYTLGRACRPALDQGAGPARAEALRAAAEALAGFLNDGAGQTYLAGLQLGWDSFRRSL